jgi:hypothetical protein
VQTRRRPRSTPSQRPWCSRRLMPLWPRETAPSS